MKKFLTSFAVATLCALSANAQTNDATTTATTTPTQASSTATTTPTTNAPKRGALVRELKKEHQQDEQKDKANPTLQGRKQMLDNRMAKRQEMYNNATPEQKARMDAMSKLTPEQKEAVRKERERHHLEMKKITGIDMPDNK